MLSSLSVLLLSLLLLMLLLLLLLGVSLGAPALVREEAHLLRKLTFALTLLSIYVKFIDLPNGNIVQDFK